MDLHEERTLFFQKHAKQMQTSFKLYFGNDIPHKLISNAIKKYAHDADENTVIGLFDCSVFGNGKSGMLFTDEKLYFTQVIGKPQRIYYTDIISVSIYDEHFIIKLISGGAIEVFNNIENKNIVALNSFIDEIKVFNDSVNEKAQKEAIIDDKNSSADSGRGWEDGINWKEVEDTIVECEETLNMIDCMLKGKSIKELYYSAKHQNSELLKTIEAYFPQIEEKSATYCSYYSGRRIPKKMLDKVTSKIDRSIDIDTVIGIIDTTPLDSGKTGYVFTNDKLYSKNTFEKTKITRYWNIKEITILDDGKDDSRKSINIKLITGDNLKITDVSIAKTPFKACLDELVRVSKNL